MGLGDGKPSDAQSWDVLVGPSEERGSLRLVAAWWRHSNGWLVWVFFVRMYSSKEVPVE